MARPQKSDRSESLVGSGTLYALATVAPILSTLLITPAITRMLGATQYGLVGISITLYQMFAIVLSLGLPAAITRHAIIATSSLEGAVALVRFGSIASVLGGALLIATVPFWGSLFIGEINPWVLGFPMISASGLAILTLCQSLFRAVGRVSTFVAMGVLSAVSGPVLGLLSALANGPHAASYLGGLAAGHFGTGVVALILTLLIKRPRISRADIMTNLRIGLPTVPHSIASAFLVSVLVVMASIFGSVEDAGRLQLALLLGTAPLILLGAFNNSWAPMIYRASDEARAPLLSQTTKAISVIVFALVGGFCTFAQPVIAFIAGPELYIPEMLSTAVLTTIAAPFMALYLSNVHLVFLSGRTGMLALTTPLSLVVAMGYLFVTAAGLSLHSLATFALGIPVFHLSQWFMSMWLRRRSGYDAPRVASSMPALSLSVLTALLVALLHPSFLPTLAAFVPLCLLLAYLSRSALRASSHISPS